MFPHEAPKPVEFYGRTTSGSNKMKSVSFSDQRARTPSVFIKGYKYGNTLITEDPPGLAPGNEWIQEGLNQMPKPKKSSLKQYEEDKYPRLKLQTEILELLDTDLGEPPKTKQWPLTPTKMVKTQRYETFAEFKARMSTRSDGSLVSDQLYIGPPSQQAQPPSASAVQKPKAKAKAKETLKSNEAKSDDSITVLKEPAFDGKLSGASLMSSVFEQQSKSAMEKELDKLFPSTPASSIASSMWENPHKHIGRNALIHKAQRARLDRRLGRPGILQWHPPKKTTGVVLPNGDTLTPGGVRIIRDYPPQQTLQDKIAEARVDKPKNPTRRESIVTAFPPRRTADKPGKIGPMIIDEKVTALTKKMLAAVDACTIPRKFKQFVPRNVKPDEDSDPTM